MKVVAFLDRSMGASEFSVNCIYQLNGYRSPLKPQSSYNLEFNRSLYLVGGRASIEQFCRDNPFRLTSSVHEEHNARKFRLQVQRGVPGLSNAERKKLGLQKESLFGNAMGIFKSKMLTVVQITHGVAISNNDVALTSPSSITIPRAMHLFETTQLQGIMALTTGDDDLVAKAMSTRDKHNTYHRNF